MTERCSRQATPTGWSLAAIAAVLLVCLYLLRFAVLPVVCAAILAYLLQPSVDRLRRSLHLPRLAAVLLVYGIVVGSLVLVTWWGVASFRHEAADAVARLPELLVMRLRGIVGSEPRWFGRVVTPDEAVDRLSRATWAWLAEPAPLVMAGSLLIAGPAALVLTFVLLFYFLHGGRRLAEGVLWLAPPAYRSGLRHHWRRIDPMLRRYLRGILLVVLYTSVAAWVVLHFALGVALALPVAVIVGVLELVPVIGPATAMALLVTVGLIDGGGSARLAMLAGLAIALRVSIDALVGPLVLGGSVTLHPVVVIVAFLFAGTLFGVVGVVFAVPTAAAIKLVLQVVYDEPPRS